MSLVEMLVVLVVMGIVAGVSAVAVGSLAAPPGVVADPLADARARAIRSGAAVRARGDSSSAPVLFLPDGRVIGAGFDPLTGEASGAGSR